MSRIYTERFLYINESNKLFDLKDVDEHFDARERKATIWPVIIS